MINSMILVPTEFERNTLLRVASSLETPEVKTIGMGLMAAGIGAAELLTKHKPETAILVGIAGTFDQTLLRIGEAVCFDSVRVDGFGVREQLHERSFGDLGWSHDDRNAIQDEVELSRRDGSRLGHMTLLSVPSASGDFAVAGARQERHPGVVAEDMESFSVALVCQRLEIPLTVCRGISNEVGDRNKANWEVAEALTAVAGRLTDLLGNRKQ